MKNERVTAAQGGEASVELWADDSPASTGLEQSLREQGYEVKHISTESSEPIARTGYCFFSGYGTIAAQLLR